MSGSSSFWEVTSAAGIDIDRGGPRPGPDLTGSAPAAWTAPARLSSGRWEIPIYASAAVAVRSPSVAQAIDSKRNKCDIFTFHINNRDHIECLKLNGILRRDTAFPSDEWFSAIENRLPVCNKRFAANCKKNLE